MAAPKRSLFHAPGKGFFMAEEKEIKPNEPQGGETDWQAKYEEMRKHSREWEAKAKQNKAAADELEQLKAAQMSEQEKANARAEAAEAELNALKAEKARNDLAKTVADETGVPVDLLAYCPDETAMRDFAEKFNQETHKPAAPSAAAARIIRSGETKPTPREQFAAFLDDAGF